MPHYFVTVAGREYDVEIHDEDGGNYAILVDGKKRVVDAVAPRGDLFSMLIDHESHDVVVGPAPGRRDDSNSTRLLVRWRGQNLAVDVVDERRRAMRELTSQLASRHGRHEVRSPMPGKVVKWLVQAGAQVSSGQGLVVIEAMKMENEITSPSAGTVVELSAQAGSPVAGGALLAVVE
jgi:biotin carboxyl carrier protein